VKRYISLLKMFFDTESLEMDEALADQGTYTARVQDLDNVELASARINEFYDDIITSCQKEYKVYTAHRARTPRTRTPHTHHRTRMHS
jgi:hypothetical protein